MSKTSSCCFSQSIIQKKTNIRRQRREIFLQGHRQKHAQATEQSVQQQQQQQQQPLKQVENYTAVTNAQANQAVQSSPIKSMMNKSEGVTVAFGRTTKIQHQRSPSASKSLVRRHSLENDNVSTVYMYLSAQN